MSRFRKEGHLLIDHRASPGLTPEEVHRAGLDPATAVPGGKTWETSTIKCAHCGTIVIMNPERLRTRGHCRKCDKFVCDACSGVECVPFEKRVDHGVEQRFRLLNNYTPLPTLILPR